MSSSPSTVSRPTDVPPAVPADPSDLPRRAVDTIRTLAIDGVQAANSGHPGMPMGCAPMAYVLFRDILRHDPARPDWPGRDRFVLSAGHGSMLLYAALHLTGYERPTLDDLRAFRQLGSVTAGHPEHDLLAAVETTTGPLGQGFATGVGMAIAAERLAAELASTADATSAAALVPQRVYAIVSDGDLMEGVAAEAASLAGHLRLGRLVYLYDDNRITIDGTTDLSFSEDVLARFDAYGWHTQRVTDGNDLDALRSAIATAHDDERPSLIAVRTTIGYGSPAKAGTSASHGAPLGADEVVATKAALGWPASEPFTVPDDVRDHLDAHARGSKLSSAWDDALAGLRSSHPAVAADYERRVVRGVLPEGWEASLPTLAGSKATRVHSGSVLNAIAPALPELIGGSADLAASNNTDLEGAGDFSATDRTGRNLRFGIREHAMAAAANGIALHGGFVPYVATFMVFSDYLRPSLRLAALMHQRVVYVLTHDSIGLGEDGPTHQPVEHLAALRAIPNVEVLRPADGGETVLAWRHALTRQGPTVLALTRQGLPDLAEVTGAPVPDTAVEHGAWVVRDAEDGATPEVVLIGTGSEVGVCLAAADELARDGVDVRVVSMPSPTRFRAADAAVREAVLPAGVTARVAVEAGVAQGWEGIVGERGEVVAMSSFGASAPAEQLFAHFGFSAANVARVARRVMDRAR
jgi:transketolase